MGEKYQDAIKFDHLGNNKYIDAFSLRSFLNRVKSSTCLKNVDGQQTAMLTVSLIPWKIEEENKNIREDASVKKIVNKAKEVREKAYCPYSKFSVGAALLCDDGEIFDGCNVENVSYGLTICAERSAICKAVSQGQKVFKSIAICAEMKEHFVSPCGACRQVLAEFNLNMDVYLCKPNNEIFKTSMDKLLPFSFSPNSVSFSSQDPKNNI